MATCIVTGRATYAVQSYVKISRLATKTSELANAGVKLGSQLGKKVVN